MHLCGESPICWTIHILEMLFINMGVTRFATLAVLLVLACSAPGATAKNEVPNKSKTSRFGRSPKLFAYDARAVLLELNGFYDGEFI